MTFPQCSMPCSTSLSICVCILVVCLFSVKSFHHSLSIHLKDLQLENQYLEARFKFHSEIETKNRGIYSAIDAFDSSLSGLDKAINISSQPLSESCYSTLENDMNIPLLDRSSLFFEKYHFQGDIPKSIPDTNSTILLISISPYLDLNSNQNIVTYSKQLELFFNHLKFNIHLQSSVFLSIHFDGTGKTQNLHWIPPFLKKVLSGYNYEISFFDSSPFENNPDFPDFSALSLISQWQVRNSIFRISSIEKTFKTYPQFKSIIFLSNRHLPSPDFIQFHQDLFPIYTQHQDSFYLIASNPSGKDFFCHNSNPDTLNFKTPCSAVGPLSFGVDVGIWAESWQTDLRSFSILQSTWNKLIKSQLTIEMVKKLTFSQMINILKPTKSFFISPCRSRVYNLDDIPSNNAPKSFEFPNMNDAKMYFYDNFIQQNANWVSAETFGVTSAHKSLKHRVLIQCAQTILPKPLPIEFIGRISNKIQVDIPDDIPRNFWFNLYNNYLGGWIVGPLESKYRNVQELEPLIDFSRTNTTAPFLLERSLKFPSFKQTVDRRFLFPVWVVPFLHQLPISFRPVCSQVESIDFNNFTNIPHCKVECPSLYAAHISPLNPIFPNSLDRHLGLNLMLDQKSTDRTSNTPFQDVFSLLNSFSEKYEYQRNLWELYSPYEGPRNFLNPRVCTQTGPNPPTCFGQLNE